MLDKRKNEKKANKYKGLNTCGLSSVSQAMINFVSKSTEQMEHLFLEIL